MSFMGDETPLTSYKFPPLSYHVSQFADVCGIGRFTPSNYHKNSIFKIQLWNRITKDIQLLKPGKFNLLCGFEGVFPISENYKYLNLN